MTIAGPRKPVRLQSCKRFVFRFSVFASTCIVFLFLGAMYCFSSCNLSCEEYRCSSSSGLARQDVPIIAAGDGGGGWSLGRLFGRAANKPALSAFMVVLIMSSASNMERRVTIRQTWLKDVQSDVLHLFVIGSSVLDDDEKRTLESEISRFQDILFLTDVGDSYDNLTQKLLVALSWVDANVADYEFLLKADDDTFARLDDIAFELLSLRNKDRLYWGFFSGHSHVQRKGKWQENSWVLCDYYLPYARGGGYVLSSDLVRFVASNRRYLKLYASEDVSLGAWLAPVDVKRVHDPRFDTEYQSRGCFNVYLVTHKQSIEQMREKYWLLQEKGKLCAAEQRNRLSYDYNWSVPPTQCCTRNDSKIP